MGRLSAVLSNIACVGEYVVLGRLVYRGWCHGISPVEGNVAVRIKRRQPRTGYAGGSEVGSVVAIQQPELMC